MRDLAQAPWFKHEITSEQLTTGWDFSLSRLNPRFAPTVLGKAHRCRLLLRHSFVKECMSAWAGAVNPERFARCYPSPHLLACRTNGVAPRAISVH